MAFKKSNSTKTQEQLRKEKAGYLGITLMSTIMIATDIATSGGSLVSPPAAGITILSLFQWNRLRRDAKKSETSFGWKDD